MDSGDDISTPMVIVDSMLQFRQVHGEIFGRILIENMCEKCPVIYRLKSNATNKFSVRKGAGIIEGGGVASIHVDVTSTTNPSSIQSEILHVLVTPIPAGMIPYLHLPSPDRPQFGPTYNNTLKRMWKDLRDRGVDYENHVLTCAIDENVILGAVAAANGMTHEPGDRSSFSYGMQMGHHFGPEAESREMRRLEKMMSQWANCTNHLHDKVDGMQRNVWRMIGFILVLLTIFCVSLVKNKINNGVSFAIHLNDSGSVNPTLFEYVNSIAKEYGQFISEEEFSRATQLHAQPVPAPGLEPAPSPE